MQIIFEILNKLKTEELTYHLIFCEIVLRPPASISVGALQGPYILLLVVPLGEESQGILKEPKLSPQPNFQLSQTIFYIEEFTYLLIIYEIVLSLPPPPSTQAPFGGPYHEGVLGGGDGGGIWGYPRSKWRSFLKSSILKTPIDIFCDIVLSPLFPTPWAPFQGLQTSPSVAPLGEGSQGTLKEPKFGPQPKFQLSKTILRFSLNYMNNVG